MQMNFWFCKSCS